jgi:transcriptional regulator with XRE-family HTH domain
MESLEDYRDTLQQLFDTLHREQGMTLSQIARVAGMGEQRLSGVLRKERNLSPRSLQRLLGRLGYSMQFEKITSPASSPSVSSKS